MHTRPLALSMAMLLVSCSAEPGAAATNAALVTPMMPGAASPEAPMQGALKLAGPVGAEATAAVLAEAERQGIKEVEIAANQSFRVMDGTREIATLVTGEGNMPDAVNAGCFLAVRQARNVELIPTIGSGDYEAQTCSGPTAVGLLSSGPTVRIVVIFQASSPNADGTEPLVIDWKRSDGTLLIDTAASRQALNSGETTIAAIRRVIG